jgi:MFS family permease
VVTLSSSVRGGPVPRIIKRNTMLLAATQAFVGMGTQMMPALGPIIVMQIMGTATLAGLSTSMTSLSRILIAYPIGWVADTLGRRPALFIGQSLCLLGTFTLGAAVFGSSLPLFVAGILIFGLGQGAGQQLRLAAADLYPPARRAEGLGLVLTGSLAGALGGPLLISLAQRSAASLGLDPLGLVWFMVPAVLLPGMGLVFLIRPDPREIAGNLHRFYLDLGPEAPRPPDAPTGVGFRAWVGHYPLLVAFIAGFGAQGVMMLMMVMTSLALAHHGHDLPMISLSVALHTVGMFGFSLPIGHLTDRLGRRNAMLLGTIVTAFGGGLVVLLSGWWAVTLGTFLVGVGWCCINIASTALISDLVAPSDRGRAIGTNDTFSAAGAIFFPLLGGLIVELYGLPAVALVSTGLMLIPFVLLLRLHEGRLGGLPVAVSGS